MWPTNPSTPCLTSKKPISCRARQSCHDVLDRPALTTFSLVMSSANRTPLAAEMRKCRSSRLAMLTHPCHLLTNHERKASPKAKVLSRWPSTRRDDDRSLLVNLTRPMTDSWSAASTQVAAEFPKALALLLLPTFLLCAAVYVQLKGHHRSFVLLTSASIACYWACPWLTPVHCGPFRCLQNFAGTSTSSTRCSTVY